MRWIIGDVHGMLRPLEALLKEVSRADPKPLFYFVGDYVNRGRESKGVIDLVLTLDDAKFIRGNHDDVLDQILHGVSYADNPSRGDRFLAMQWFLEHGLFETLHSYGATGADISRALTERRREALQPIIDLFPASHRRFIRALPIVVEEDDLFIIHGKWNLRETTPPTAMLGGGSLPAAALRHQLLWGRFTDEELARPCAWNKVGYFGHTPVPTYVGYAESFFPIVTEKLVLLDTAAALSPLGRLTAYCAETRDYLQTDVNGRLVKLI
jgi:hypothetical protein